MRKTEGGEWEVSVKPSVHTYMTPKDIRDMPLKDYAQFSKEIDFLSPPKQYRSKLPRPATPDTYESCYWKYVKSDTTDDALYWFNQMITKVTMDLQPAGKDWKSWVADPVDELPLFADPEDDRISLLGRICMTILIVGIYVPILLMILNLTGILK